MGRVMRRITILITHITRGRIIILLIATHEPPSRWEAKSQTSKSATPGRF